MRAARALSLTAALLASTCLRRPLGRDAVPPPSAPDFSLAIAVNAADERLGARALERMKDATRLTAGDVELAAKLHGLVSTKEIGDA